MTPTAMNGGNVLAVFANEEDLRGAVGAARAAGLRIVEVFTPYAVHGLNHALGLKPSRLSRVCFALGLSGAVAALYFQQWASAVDWAINIGGKPWNSIPAFAPIAFEVMVLFSGLGTVAAFLLVSRLYPGRRASMPDARVTNDCFVMVVENTGAAFPESLVRDVLKRFHGVQVPVRGGEVSTYEA